MQHLEKFGVKGILVIPVWPRSQIFHFFFPDGIYAANWVENLVLINPAFVSSYVVGDCFKGYQQYQTVALSFNFGKCQLSFRPSQNRFLCLKSGCSFCWTECLKIFLIEFIFTA